MTPENAKDELLMILKQYEHLLEKLPRKRMRISEKVMTQITFKRRIDALKFVIEAISKT